MKRKTASGLLAPDILLREVRFVRYGSIPAGFPFNVPVIQALDNLEFTAPVTFLVGENGCGKSTLLEAIAAAAGSITVGSEQVGNDPTLVSLRLLARYLKLTWNKRTRRGFFMRSEDFFGFARRMSGLREDLQRNLEEVEREYENKSPTARIHARAAYEGQLSALEQSYGEGLDARSHGESYLQLFQARFVPEGLYLLDEPEAPLSPLRQLSFLVLLQNMVAQNGQFIIATHSPILMAFPGAQILSFDGGRIQPVAYADTEHYQITRSFLEDPQRYLSRLLDESGD